MDARRSTKPRSVRDLDACTRARLLHLHRRNPLTVCAPRDGGADGYWLTAEKLLNAGADVNAMNAAKETAVMLASRYGHQKMVSVLLEARANLEVGRRAIERLRAQRH